MGMRQAAKALEDGVARILEGRDIEHCAGPSGQSTLETHFQYSDFDDVYELGRATIVAYWLMGRGVIDVSFAEGEESDARMLCAILVRWFIKNECKAVHYEYEPYGGGHDAIEIDGNEVVRTWVLGC